MLDGMAITGFLLLLNAVARLPHQKRWGVWVGPAIGWIVMTKGLLAAPLVAIALGWCSCRWWFGSRQDSGQEQSPRRALMALAQNPWLWAGLGIGLAPAFVWYGSQIHHYGMPFIQQHVLSQGFGRLSQQVEGHSGPPWYYLLEILKYGWPWLLALPGGGWMAWRYRRESWGSLVWVGLGGYVGLVSVMGTKLPWYVMPAYPFIALAVGALLGELWSGTIQPYSRGWSGGLMGLLLAVGVGFYYLFWQSDWTASSFLFLLVLLLFAESVRLFHMQNRRFVLMVCMAMYVGMASLFMSDIWLWELNEAFPVGPVASLMTDYIAPGDRLYSSLPYNRPSLNFYCHCHVTRATLQVLQQEQHDHFLLLDDRTVLELAIAADRIVGSAEGLSLVRP